MGRDAVAGARLQLGMSGLEGSLEKRCFFSCFSLFLLHHAQLHLPQTLSPSCKTQGLQNHKVTYPCATNQEIGQKKS